MTNQSRQEAIAHVCVVALLLLAGCTATGTTTTSAGETSTAVERDNFQIVTAVECTHEVTLQLHERNMSGPVVASDTGHGPFTFENVSANTTYAVTGTDGNTTRYFGFVYQAGDSPARINNHDSGWCL